MIYAAVVTDSMDATKKEAATATRTKNNLDAGHNSKVVSATVLPFSSRSAS